MEKETNKGGGVVMRTTLTMAMMSKIHSSQFTCKNKVDKEADKEGEEGKR